MNETMNEPLKNNKTVTQHLAHIVRVVSIPPLMVAVILVLLWFFRPELFTAQSQLWLSECFLSLFPILAYPLSAVIPSIRQKGRDGQRNLAMYLSAAGYLCAVLYGIFSGCTEGLRIIHLTYLLSVVLLLILNKLLRIRASGHACSVSGPILLLCLYIGVIGAFTGILIWTVIFWASLKIKRHTPKEYLIGSAVPIVAYGISYLIYMLV